MPANYSVFRLHLNQETRAEKACGKRQKTGQARWGIFHLNLTNRDGKTMRKHAGRLPVTLLLLPLMLGSPLSAQDQGTSTMPDNALIIREFIQAWSRLDAGELAGYFTEDGTYHNIPASAVSGREPIAQFIAGFTEHWQSRDWEIISLFADGDRVMAERIDHTVVNGRPVDLPAVGVFEMENGKIKVWRDYFDLATYTDALTAALQAQ